MELHLRIIGFILVLLAIVHIGFPRHFNWAKELNSLSLINRQMMYVHTFFVALVVFLMGLICFFSSKELVGTELGKKVCMGLGTFWGIRLMIQFLGFSSELWKGKTFETTIHILFVLLWTYLSIVFCSIAWTGYNQ